MSNNINSSVTFSMKVDAPFDSIRSAITDPAWSKFLPFLKADQCEGDFVGAKRICIMASPDPQNDGYELIETITENDKEAGRLGYTIENPPLPVENLRGVMEASQNEQGEVIVNWTSYFMANDEVLLEVREMMIGMYQMGLQGLETYSQKI